MSSLTAEGIAHSWALHRPSASWGPHVQGSPSMRHPTRLVLPVLGAVGLLSFAVARATNPPGAPADHFLAYKTKAEKVPPFAKITGVSLVDQFESGAFDVLAPADLLVPADKNGEGIADAVTHLRAYKIKASRGGPKHVKQLGVSVTNQFGTLSLDTMKPPGSVSHAVESRRSPLTRSRSGVRSGPESRPTCSGIGVRHRPERSPAWSGTRIKHSEQPRTLGEPSVLGSSGCGWRA